MKCLALLHEAVLKMNAFTWSWVNPPPPYINTVLRHCFRNGQNCCFTGIANWRKATGKRIVMLNTKPVQQMSQFHCFYVLSFYTFFYIRNVIDSVTISVGERRKILG